MDKPALRFSIAPDTHPDSLPGWHIFLRHVQKQLDVSIKIADYANFSDLRQGLEQDQVDMIFASAADTSYLVNHKDFLALAQPETMSLRLLCCVVPMHLTRKLKTSWAMCAPSCLLIALKSSIWV